MRKMAPVLFAFAVMASGCGETGSGDGGTGGAGGAVDCESLRLACSGLDESECEQDEGCYPVKAWPWDGDLQACISQPLDSYEFVTCTAGGDDCGATGFGAPGCIWHPSDPQRCFCERGVTNLRGWEYAIECESPPGTCGN